jgi:hypothetical protein
MASMPATIRVASRFPFPSLVTGAAPITINKNNGIWAVGFSIIGLAVQNPVIANYPTDYVLVYDAVAQTYFRMPLSVLTAARNQRSVAASPIVIAGSDQILNLNIGAGAPTCALPTYASRNGIPLTFVDVGKQAQAHNITLTPNGAETIANNPQVGPSFVMATNGQAVTLNPFNDGTNTGWFIT